MGAGGLEADLVDLEVSYPNLPNGVECTSMGTWDVSDVTDFSRILYNLEGYDDSSIANGEDEIDGPTFQSRKAVFNVQIGNWDTGSATTMNSAIRGAKRFNQQLFWDTAVSNHHCLQLICMDACIHACIR